MDAQKDKAEPVYFCAQRGCVQIEQPQPGDGECPHCAMCGHPLQVVASAKIDDPAEDGFPGSAGDPDFPRGVGDHGDRNE